MGGVFGPVAQFRLERPAHNRAVMRSNRIGPILFVVSFFGDTWFEKLSIHGQSYPDIMKCPVCEMDCITPAKDLLATLPSVFLPCADCSIRNLDKRLPLPTLHYEPPCSCGKRFIDEVFAHMYTIMVEEGDLKLTDPLISVGTPLGSSRICHGPPTVSS